MSYPVFSVPAGTVFYVPFTTYDKDDGSSITMTGLAVTDIKIYKNGSVTQRASENGYTLLDTDGTDFDGITGLHGFSIDLADNSDAGFYAVGSWYFVAVSTITVDSVTVTFIACAFRITPAESSAGVPKVDVSHLLGTAWLAPGTAGTPDVNTKLISGDATAADNAEAFFDGTGYAGTNNVIPTVTLVNGLGANVITAAATAADFSTEANAAVLAILGTPAGASLAADIAAIKAAVDVIDDFLDTEIAAILAAVDTEVAAIKAKTDPMTYTVANVLDANIQRVNDVALIGDGAATPWGP